MDADNGSTEGSLVAKADISIPFSSFLRLQMKNAIKTAATIAIEGNTMITDKIPFPKTGGLELDSDNADDCDATYSGFEDGDARFEEEDDDNINDVSEPEDDENDGVDDDDDDCGLELDKE